MYGGTGACTKDPHALGTTGFMNMTGNFAVGVFFPTFTITFVVTEILLRYIKEGGDCSGRCVFVDGPLGYLSVLAGLAVSVYLFHTEVS